MAISIVLISKSKTKSLKSYIYDVISIKIFAPLSSILFKASLGHSGRCLVRLARTPPHLPRVLSYLAKYVSLALLWLY